VRPFDIQLSGSLPASLNLAASTLAALFAYKAFSVDDSGEQAQSIIVATTVAMPGVVMLFNRSPAIGIPFDYRFGDFPETSLRTHSREASRPLDNGKPASFFIDDRSAAGLAVNAISRTASPVIFFSSADQFTAYVLLSLKTRSNRSLNQ
jgi:hypothetical protein